MNYVDLRRYDASNLSGINTTLFISGCSNKEQQSFNYGKSFTKEVEDLFISYAKDPHVDGVFILGGEPLQQDFDAMFNLVKRIKAEADKPIHMWSGYTWEEILQDDEKTNILLWIDTLVNGHREIDVQRSLLEGRMVIW